MHTLITFHCWISHIHVCIVFMRIYMKYPFNEIHNKKIPCKTYYIDPSQSFAIYLLALKFEMADSLSIQTFDHPHTSPPHWSMMHANGWSSVVTQNVYESFYSVWLGPDESKRIDLQLAHRLDEQASERDGSFNAPAIAWPRCFCRPSPRPLTDGQHKKRQEFMFNLLLLSWDDWLVVSEIE